MRRHKLLRKQGHSRKTRNGHIPEWGSLAIFVVIGFGKDLAQHETSVVREAMGCEGTGGQRDATQGFYGEGVELGKVSRYAGQIDECVEGEEEMTYTSVIFILVVVGLCLSRR